MAAKQKSFEPCAVDRYNGLMCNWLTPLRRWVLAGLVISAVGCRPSDSPDATPVMSAQNAAQLVSAASASERGEAADAQVRKRAQEDPDTLNALLEEIVTLVPETAPACARAAVLELPDRAAEWVATVVRTLPESAALVVSEVCQAAPDHYAAITVAAGRAAPQSSHSIVLALSEALPDLDDTLERAKTLAGRGRASHPSVPVVIYQTVELVELDRVTEQTE